MLLVSQWWFFVTVWESMLLLHRRPPLGIGILACLPGLPAGDGDRIAAAEADARNAPLRLLLLRVFGAQRRSEGRCQVVCVNTSMEVSTDDGCCGIRTWDAGGAWAGV